MVLRERVELWHRYLKSISYGEFWRLVLHQFRHRSPGIERDAAAFERRTEQGVAMRTNHLRLRHLQGTRIQRWQHAPAQSSGLQQEEVSARLTNGQVPSERTV